MELRFCIEERTESPVVKREDSLCNPTGDTRLVLQKPSPHVQRLGYHKVRLKVGAALATAGRAQKTRYLIPDFLFLIYTLI